DDADDVVGQTRLNDLVVVVHVDRDRDVRQRDRRQRLLLVGLRLDVGVALSRGAEDELEELVARGNLRRDLPVEALDRLEVGLRCVRGAASRGWRLRAASAAAAEAARRTDRGDGMLQL